MHSKRLYNWLFQVQFGKVAYVQSFQSLDWIYCGGKLP